MNITVEEAKRVIDTYKENPNFCVVDVRTQGEWDEGHIPQSLHMDIQRPDFQQRLSELDQQKTYVVFCLSGGRSSAAVEMMKDMGFTKVYNVAGNLMGFLAAKA